LLAFIFYIDGKYVLKRNHLLKVLDFHFYKSIYYLFVKTLYMIASFWLHVGRKFWYIFKSFQNALRHNVWWGHSLGKGKKDWSTTYFKIGPNVATTMG
jgi:hypothetical protein